MTAGAIARYRRLFAHDAWANRRMLQTLVRPGTPPPRALEILAHVIGAEWLWLRRLGRAGAELPVWPRLSPQECDHDLRELALAWTACLDDLGDGQGLAREVSYVNTKGEPWTNRAGDVIEHVLQHSTYHRGQIATLLAETGATPPYTDYIEFVRRGYEAE